jgi:hypothetical protein
VILRDGVRERRCEIENVFQEGTSKHPAVVVFELQHVSTRSWCKSGNAAQDEEVMPFGVYLDEVEVLQALLCAPGGEVGRLHFDPAAWRGCRFGGEGVCASELIRDGDSSLAPRVRDCVGLGLDEVSERMRRAYSRTPSALPGQARMRRCGRRRGPPHATR